MKRFIAILLAAVIFSVSAAQAQIIHVKSTSIEITKRERNRTPLKLDYRGFVEADLAFCIDDSYQNGFGITATYGCLLKDFLFIGAGTGIRMDRYSLYGRAPSHFGEYRYMPI